VAAASPARRGRASGRRRALRRPPARFSARREVAIGLAAYAVALAVRAAVARPGGRRRARQNAGRLVALERQLGIHVEPELQRLLLPRRRLLAVLNVLYVTVNVGLTVGWLMRLFARRHPEFHRLRGALVLSTLGAQCVFLPFPCDPPRALPHLVDTIADVTRFDLDSGLVVRLYNPVAAMPSIHLAWAVVTSAGVLAASDGPVVRAAARAYPGAVAFTVVVTANHYVLDVAAGAALGAGALALAKRLA